MRVLHIVSSVGPGSGGVGMAALSLARAQRDAGCEIAIWSQDPPQVIADAASEWLLTGTILGFPIWGLPIVGFSPTAERYAASAAGSQFDVVHQHGIWQANSRVTNQWRIAHRRPTVVAPQGTLQPVALQRSRLKKQLALVGYEARNLHAATCLQATAEPELQSIRCFGLRNPVAIIPNSIPDDWLVTQGDGSRFRQRHAIPSDKRLLLFLSRIHPIKGLPLLFEAVAARRAELIDWRLVLAGTDEGGHRHTLEVLARQLGIAELVQFVGPVFGEDKRDAFAAADVFVLPSYSENFGTVIAEALGAGIPVITTHGTPWVDIETRGCGWWVDTNAHSLAEAISDAAQHSVSELVAMGRRGRALVSDGYTWRQVAQKTVCLYTWLLGRGDRPAFVKVD